MQRTGGKYNVGYQVDGGTIIPLIIKTPKNIFSYGVSQNDKDSSCTISSNLFEVEEWVPHYRNTWNEFEERLHLKSWHQSLKKEKVNYAKIKLKTCKERIKVIFRDQKVLYNMYCNITAVLKVDSVCKQGKSYDI